MISDQAQEAQEVNCAVPRQHGYVRVTAQVKILLAAIHIDYIYLILPNLMTMKIDEYRLKIVPVLRTKVTIYI